MRAELCHHYDVIGHVTIPLSIDDLPYVLDGNQIRISLSFRDIQPGK